jgi:flagellar L-ring protein precursor FlgH
MEMKTLMIAIVMIMMSAGLAYGDSLAAEDSSSSLFSAKTACREGDQITILLEESTVSTFEANGKQEKASTIEMKDSKVLPQDISLFGLVFGQLLNSNNKNSNTHTTSLTQSVTTTLSVRVSKVLENGDLLIEGTRTLVLNNESHMVKIRGIVRQKDVGPDNTVSSKKVSNAEITLDGIGKEGKRKKGGILQQLFQILF